MKTLKRVPVQLVRVCYGLDEVCSAGCEKEVFGWTPQQADVAWKEHECKTPKT